MLKQIEINCFSDASYSQQKSISIVAYKIHNEIIKTIILPNVKNTEAELFGIEFCIEYVIQNYPLSTLINIFTDCQNAWKQNYSKYKININLIKVKGHQKMNLMNENDLIFKQVDKIARKTLRNFIV